MIFNINLFNTEISIIAEPSMICVEDVEHAIPKAKSMRNQNPFQMIPPWMRNILYTELFN